MKKWFYSLLSLSITPSDSPEMAMWKRILTGATFLGAVNVSVFGAVMWALGVRITAAGMFFYALINLVTLPIFLVTKNANWFRNSQLGLLAIASGIFTITLGGYSNLASC